MRRWGGKGVCYGQGAAGACGYREIGLPILASHHHLPMPCVMQCIAWYVAHAVGVHVCMWEDGEGRLSCQGTAGPCGHIGMGRSGDVGMHMGI